MTDWWRKHGYAAATELGEGLWLVIAPQVYTWRLMLCTEEHVEQFWCYPRDEFRVHELIDWMMEFAAAGAKGDPHEGWVKHHPTKRRPRSTCPACNEYGHGIDECTKIPTSKGEPK